MRFWIAIAVILCGVQVNLSAQQQTNSTQKETENYVRINYDNDFFTATDRYYTQGIRIEYINSFLYYSPLSKLLIPAGKDARNYYGIAINQNVYTPKKITDSVDERPYASTLYLSSFLTSLLPEKHIRLTSQFDMGVVGPAAGGEHEQKAIHGLLSDFNAQPVGWDRQIQNDVILNYTMQFEKGIVNTPYFELIGIANARAGTLNDDISAGAMFRTGLLHPYFESLGLYKNADKTHGINNFQVYFFARGLVTFTGYDATMQGGIFNRKSVHTLPYADLNKFTAGVYTGVVFSYKRVGLEFAHLYSTPQFKGGLYNGWGHCNITIAF